MATGPGGASEGSAAPEAPVPLAAGTNGRGPVARVLYVVGGSFALALGVLGLVVPLLPTTPFLLLSAACYLRGSERLHGWLLSHRRLGRFIADYQAGRGIPRRAKIISVVLLWATIGLSLVWVVSHLALRAGLAAIALGVTAHLLRMPTLRPQGTAEPPAGSTEGGADGAAR